jgi:hemerythrin-like domain-containing protein
MSALDTRQPRPARSPAPAVPTMDKLDKTHAQMLVVLDQLTALMDHLESEGVDPAARETARSICAFFNENARQHHADEEALIFPKLLQAGDAEIVQHVHRLQQDHGWLEEDWIELGPQLQAVSEGYSWYDLDTLRAAVGIFADLYHDHIGLEESMIYPHARRQTAA